MLEELTKIEIADVEALVVLKEEKDALQKLVDNATSSKGKVAPAIYTRVMKDYGLRLAALEDKARPLRQKARAEFAKLRALHAQLKQKLDGAQLDQSELEFRHQIGELSDPDFEARREGAREALAASQADFEEADRISQRFLEVVPAEPEPPATPPPPPPGLEKVTTAELPVPAAAEEDDEAEGPDFGTVVVTREEAMSMSRGDVAPPAKPAALRARLVEDRDGKPGKSLPLAATTTIGRTPDNDLQLDTAEVSRRHAQIVLADGEFTITDNNSGNGTFVNGERITRQKLKDGDKVQIGPEAFLFRES